MTYTTFNSVRVRNEIEWGLVDIFGSIARQAVGYWTLDNQTPILEAHTANQSFRKTWNRNKIRWTLQHSIVSLLTKIVKLRTSMFWVRKVVKTCWELFSLDCALLAQSCVLWSGLFYCEDHYTGLCLLN